MEGRLTPQHANREEETRRCLVTSPRDMAPSPRSSRLDLSLPGHLSSITLWKPWSVVFLHCTVSVIKKKKVLIHVNLCENYCVQQYFPVNLFFLCELSRFSFLFINVYFFFLKTNQCVVDLYVTYSLVSYYRYVIRMDILLGFRMFYKKNNS